tara:strand:+ start:698 stop:1621 length:924 start_codon:yes stop_codon:yes gene_type:complete
MGQSYYYYEGVKTFTSNLDKNQVVYGGVLPMAKMATGDWVRLVIFPLILDQEIKSSGKSVKTKYIFLVPDWDTDEVQILGSNRFYLKPHGRIYKYQLDPEGCHENRSDHWESIFLEDVAAATEGLEKINIELIRASSLLSETSFLDLLRIALNQPESIIELAEKIFGPNDASREPSSLAGPVCRECKYSVGEMEYIKDWDRIQYSCSRCGNVQEADISEQEYWVQSEVLESAALAVIDPTLKIIRENDEYLNRDSVIEGFIDSNNKGWSDDLDKMVVPFVDSERGGHSIKDLMEFAREWDKPHAELA